MQKEEKEILFNLHKDIQKIKERVCSQNCNIYDFEFNDPFKEALIHQLWHLVDEMKKINENLNELGVEMNKISKCLERAL